MAILDRLLDEYLKVLPRWVKRRLFLILSFVLLEIGTYEVFARLIGPAPAAQTFPTVVGDFRWQLTALTEFCLLAAFDLVRSSRSAKKRFRPALLSIAGALVLAPPLFYAAFAPVRVTEQRVDIFYLDDPRIVTDFDRNVLLNLLNDTPREKLKIHFNWVDWTDWNTPEQFGPDPFERLEILIDLYRTHGEISLDPVGITSQPLKSNTFSEALADGLLNRTIITTADWNERFAPPTVYHYLMHMITTTALSYRMKEKGRPLEQHNVSNSGRSYFDKVPEKANMSYVICKGEFTSKDAGQIEKTLGNDFFEAAKNVLSPGWLREGKLRDLAELQPGCP